MWEHPPPPPQLQARARTGRTAQRTTPVSFMCSVCPDLSLPWTTPPGLLSLPPRGDAHAEDVLMSSWTNGLSSWCRSRPCCLLPRADLGRKVSATIWPDCLPTEPKAHLRDDRHTHTAHGPGTTLVLRGRDSTFKLSGRSVPTVSHQHTHMANPWREEALLAGADTSTTPSSSPDGRSFLQSHPDSVSASLLTALFLSGSVKAHLTPLHQSFSPEALW